ncbi:BirA family transcriptional regulator, biotin operon repressor / biotin-[acetyl-CoA-carboxylase] ligase [Roseicitreum antarcticum]|uniref:biotin--[biotin carboxyl-carrier protein] ligase n=1 Tax=Roseicitreum antarcticum TaxID=564137 RepID=A0A1H2ZUM9_9RHOB|nr:BirA family transcriptional regulator, biotin operon repressor / biotin-[acetyl-CoA-carboxylase] ligase [Roseicitreum antarcticum]
MSADAHGAAVSDWPAGVDRVVLAEVDSTNAEAARRARDLTQPTWILALRQTAGRGRRGRAWVDPTGNFAATLVMRPAGPPGAAAQRSFIAALALFDACVAVTGRPDGFALKWPNDVLLNGCKLAGILLESLGSVGGSGGGSVGVSGAWVAHLAIGIGVNLRNAPPAQDGAVRPVNLWDEAGAAVTPEEFLDALAPAFAHYEAQFTTYGFAPIRNAWLARAARLGETITARTVTESYDGVFETIDDSGALILNTARGRMAIPAADVFFR